MNTQQITSFNNLSFEEKRLIHIRTIISYDLLVLQRLIANSNDFDTLSQFSNHLSDSINEFTNYGKEIEKD